MQYDTSSEKVPVVPMQVSQGGSSQDYKQNSDIRRKRTAVLVLLGIQLFFAIFYFIAKIVDLIRYYRIPADIREPKGAGTQIGGVVAAAISVLYIIIFIIVVVKYLRIGILIFAWLGLLELIFVLIVLILTIVAIVAISAAVKAAGVGIVISIIIVVIATIVLLLTILTVAFSFQLAKLIKMHETYRYV